jgi:hypothetical protein
LLTVVGGSLGPADLRPFFIQGVDPIVQTARILRPVGAGREPADTPDLTSRRGGPVGRAGYSASDRRFERPMKGRRGNLSGADSEVVNETDS